MRRVGVQAIGTAVIAFVLLGCTSDTTAEPPATPSTAAQAAAEPPAGPATETGIEVDSVDQAISAVEEAADCGALAEVLVDLGTDPQKRRALLQQPAGEQSRLEAAVVESQAAVDCGSVECLMEVAIVAASDDGSEASC